VVPGGSLSRIIVMGSFSSSLKLGSRYLYVVLKFIEKSFGTSSMKYGGRFIIFTVKELVAVSNVSLIVTEMSYSPKSAAEVAWTYRL